MYYIGLERIIHYILDNFCLSAHYFTHTEFGGCSTCLPVIDSCLAVYVNTNPNPYPYKTAGVKLYPVFVLLPLFRTKFTTEN